MNENKSMQAYETLSCRLIATQLLTDMKLTSIFHVMQLFHSLLTGTEKTFHLK